MRTAAAEYTDVSALTTAFSGTHVVISTVATIAIDAQVPIAQASKAAGAQVFIPSEFGVSAENLEDSLLGHKAALHAKLRELGPPLLLVYTGPWVDWMWIECVGFFVFVFWSIGVTSLVNLNVTSGKVAVGGDGKSPISFTTRPDIARCLAYVLVHAPEARLQNQTLRLEDDRRHLMRYLRVTRSAPARSST